MIGRREHVDRHGGRASVLTAVLASVDRDPSRVLLRTATADLTGEDVLAAAGGVAGAIDATADARGRSSGEEAPPVLLLVSSALDALGGTIGALAAGRTVVHADPRLGPGALAEVAALAGARLTVGSTDVRVDGLAHLDPRTLAPAPLPMPDPDPRSVAILAFTSGSTGRPKAIGRPHRALWSHATLPPDRGDPGPDERIGTLLGATGSLAAYLLRHAVQGNPTTVLDARTEGVEDLLRVWRAHGVTHLRLVPTFLRRLVAALPDGEGLPGLVRVACTGEGVTWEDVALVRARLCHRAALVNRYGMTESGPVARRVVGPDEPLGSGPLPVGVPLDGRRVWIDAGDALPASPGTPGEIVVEGDLRRVGPAYEVLPDGTERLRTGDRGVLDSAGELTHLGRVDRMVKLGGIRVELGAVEAVLRAVAGVGDVAVVGLPAPGSGETVLVAHVAPAASGPLPSDAELRAAATAGVHASAVPVRFVRHDPVLPAVVSGKVDLVALRRQAEALLAADR